MLPLFCPPPSQSPYLILFLFQRATLCHCRDQTCKAARKEKRDDQLKSRKGTSLSCRATTAQPRASDQPSLVGQSLGLSAMRPDPSRGASNSTGVDRSLACPRHSCREHGLVRYRANQDGTAEDEVSMNCSELKCSGISTTGTTHWLWSTRCWFQLLKRRSAGLPRPSPAQSRAQGPILLRATNKFASWTLHPRLLSSSPASRLVHVDHLTPRPHCTVSRDWPHDPLCLPSGIHPAGCSNVDLASELAISPCWEIKACSRASSPPAPPDAARR